jgi:DNA-binding NarL/FixJ family response regulator
MTDFSPRERQVIAALMAGKNHKEIAAELNVKPSTVSSTVASACKRIGARTSRQLVALFARKASSVAI